MAAGLGDLHPKEAAKLNQVFTPQGVSEDGQMVLGAGVVFRLCEFGAPEPCRLMSGKYIETSGFTTTLGQVKVPEAP